MLFKRFYIKFSTIFKKRVKNYVFNDSRPAIEIRINPKPSNGSVS